MINQTFLQPILSIDLKKNRIRIHKSTLHMLGDPEYIQLLVNPSARIIALRRSIREDHLAHHIKPQMLSTKNCCEIYSSDLLRTLRNVNCGWQNKQAYRIYGDLNQKEGIAQFSMNDFVLMNEPQDNIE
jgi:hypothetical protein